MAHRIVFQTNQLSIRGTEIALYDYAQYNQEILGNTSVIAFNATSHENNAEVVAKFEKKFDLYPYDHIRDLDLIIKTSQADLLYRLRIGSGPQILAQSVPTMVHEVFPVSPKEIHGASCAFVSDWLAQIYSNEKIPSVPHMIDLPDIHQNLRDDLRIPAEATVFGCHGGSGSFDIPFAKDCVRHVLEHRKDIYFIFLNITAFITHPRAIFLPASADLVYKVMFINACDAMLHARRRGESFGLACGEFSARNKPVITYALSGERNHIDTLGTRARLYLGPRTLMAQLLNFNRLDSEKMDWDAYSERFSPKNVMSLFNKHLVDVALSDSNLTARPFSLSLHDSAICWANRAKIRGIKSTRLFSRLFL
jgi:hypothetical protein